MESAQTVVAEPSPPGPTSGERGAIHDFFGAIRTRIVSGLILALPIAITFWIVIQLFQTLNALVIDPTIEVIRWVVGPERMHERTWRERGGVISRWLRDRDFVIDCGNDFWADWRGEIHSS